MGNMMATADVAKELNDLKAHVGDLHTQVSIHNALHEQNSETLKQVKDILLKQVETQGDIKRMDERFTGVYKQQDEIRSEVKYAIEEVGKNRAQINRWIGGLGALSAAFGIGVTLLKLFG